MSSFTDPLHVEILQAQINGRQAARLLRTFEYHVGFKGSSDRVVVPRGYQTDFASIPRALWTIAPPLGPYAKAAVVHDYIYDRHEGRSRLEADKIFLEAMVVLKVPPMLRSAMYLAVRVGGERGWNNGKGDLT